MDDDTPVAANDGNLDTVEEVITGHDLGAVSLLTGDDSYGADGEGDPAITIAAGDQGGTVSIVGGQLIYTNTTANATPETPVVETFEYTITDGDGDTATATFTVTLTDTGVTNVAADTNLVADDDDATNPVAAGNAGGDGDDDTSLSGTITYTLGEDAIGSVSLSTTDDTTNLLTLDGDAVDTTFVSGQLIGYVSGTDASNSDNWVFTITLGTPTNTSTTYNMELLQPVQHAGDDFEDNTIPFTVDVTVTDADGSEGYTSFTVEVDDDTPIIDPDNAIMRKEAGLLLTGDLNLAAGADGLSSLTLAIADAEDGDQIDGLTSGGQPVMYRDTGDGFEGYVVVDNVETVIFSVSPDIDGGGNYTGTYTINITGNLDGAGGETIFQLGEGIKGGNDTSFFLFEPNLEFDPDDYEYEPALVINNPGSNDDLYGGVDTSTGELYPTGLVIHAYAYNDDGDLSVNSSDFSLAVGAGQTIDGSDTLVLEFTQASSWLYDNQNSGNGTGLYENGVTSYELIGNLRFNILDFSAGERINFTTYKHVWNDDTNEYDLVEVDTGSIVATADFTSLTGNDFISFELSQDMEPGVVDNMLVEFDGDPSFSGEYDTIVFTSGGGDFKIGEMATFTEADATDQIFDVTATATDGDGDTVSDTFTVMMDGNNGLMGYDDADDVLVSGSGEHTLNGLGGDDTLIGGDSADILIGGDGNDILTGNAGADQFVWNDGDSGTDQVTDFNTGEGDVLDLADLLDPTGSLEIGVTDNLDDYLKANFDSVTNTTTIDVYTGGDANSGGSVDQSIMVNGDVSDLNSLLGSGNLDVDQS